MAVLNDLFKIIHSKLAFFKSKLRFFVKILMKFCRNFTNMLRMSRIFNFLKKRTKFLEKSVKISEMFKLFRKLFKIIQSCPYSRAGGRARPAAPGPQGLLDQEDAFLRLKSWITDVAQLFTALAKTSKRK